MLDGLVGNKNVQKVLLFLFVNNKCYGTQLQRLLKTPLTPLQNALSRLESGNVIISYFEGKSKIYQMNPGYPLLAELEQLLKKSYTLLPPQEKKLYSLVQPDGLEKKVQMPSILAFWEKLKTIKQFTKQSHSRLAGENGWNRKGGGKVLVSSPSDAQILFHERGSWNEQNIGFSNTFRWTLDRLSTMISLEHLRHGPDQPVFLFHLIPSKGGSLISLDSHLCEEDVYLAAVTWNNSRISLNWRVIGPHKNEEMQYTYL